MEINTCEQYVLNELKNSQEELTLVKKENEELKEELSEVNRKSAKLFVIAKELYKVSKDPDVLDKIEKVNVIISESSGPLSFKTNILIKCTLKDK